MLGFHALGVLPLAGSRNPQDLTATLYSDADTFGAARIDLQILAAEFVDSDSFGLVHLTAPLRSVTGINVAGGKRTSTQSRGAARASATINGGPRGRGI